MPAISSNGLLNRFIPATGAGMSSSREKLAVTGLNREQALSRVLFSAFGKINDDTGNRRQRDHRNDDPKCNIALIPGQRAGSRAACSQSFSCKGIYRQHGEAQHCAEQQGKQSLSLFHDDPSVLPTCYGHSITQAFIKFHLNLSYRFQVSR